MKVFGNEKTHGRTLVKIDDLLSSTGGILFFIFLNRSFSED